jgi:hypothetical protein
MSFQYVLKNSCQLAASSQFLSRLNKLHGVGSASLSQVIDWLFAHQGSKRVNSHFFENFSKKRGFPLVGSEAQLCAQ